MVSHSSTNSTRTGLTLVDTTASIKNLYVIGHENANAKRAETLDSKINREKKTKNKRGNQASHSLFVSAHPLSNGTVWGLYRHSSKT